MATLLDNESDTPDTKNSGAAKRQSYAERAKIMRKQQYQDAKLRQKKYLSSPEVQAKISLQKEKFKKIRKDRSDKMKDDRKAANKSAKENLAQAALQARIEKQNLRDQELKEAIRPALTLLKGGLSE